MNEVNLKGVLSSETATKVLHGFRLSSSNQQNNLRR